MIGSDGADRSASATPLYLDDGGDADGILLSVGDSSADGDIGKNPSICLRQNDSDRTINRAGVKTGSLRVSFSYFFCSTA